jgi:hypothetical protein
LVQGFVVDATARNVRERPVWHAMMCWALSGGRQGSGYVPFAGVTEIQYVWGWRLQALLRFSMYGDGEGQDVSESTAKSTRGLRLRLHVYRSNEI